MATKSTGESVGKVETKLAKLGLPANGFVLESGERLPELTVAYETYGALSPAKDNVIFICHALSGDAHVAGYHDPNEKARGWWDEMVGPGKGIDTRHYHVVCANVLGGCRGATGPSSIRPDTGRPYGSSFPEITVGDIVGVHRLLLKHLGIDRIAAAIGGSFGGMQALEWAIRYPETIDHCVCIASATSLSTQALAFDIVGRSAITSDPAWNGGDYYDTGATPASGLAQARKIGHITYLSQKMMALKFGRERREKRPDLSTADAGSIVDQELPARSFSSDFQVASYLDYQGRKFVERFDANSYLHITRAMDEYDLAERFGSLEKAFTPVQAKILVVALSDDWLFPPEQSIQLAHGLIRAGKNVSYCRLQAPHGHDAFLVDIEHLAEAIHSFLPWVGKPRIEPETNYDVPSAPRNRRAATSNEFAGVVHLIPPGARVLDLGCGDGELLTILARERAVSGVGIDIDLQNVVDVLDRGHNILQQDIDAGLAMIPDNSYDCAILSQTLQIVRKPRLVLHEMLRVAREGIISFPNFGNWSHRLRLWLSGRMPKGKDLPFEWYDTPNIHLFTLRDFTDLCRKDNIRILDTVCLPSQGLDRWLIRAGLRNLGANRVLVKIAKNTGDRL